MLTATVTRTRMRGMDAGTLALLGGAFAAGCVLIGTIFTACIGWLTSNQQTARQVTLDAIATLQTEVKRLEARAATLEARLEVLESVEVGLHAQIGELTAERDRLLAVSTSQAARLVELEARVASRGLQHLLHEAVGGGGE